MATQAYDAIIATITVANDATSVTKAMVKSTTWREGTSGAWLSTDCTLTAGKVYQFRTPNSAFDTNATAVLPNIKADVTVDWDVTGAPTSNASIYFMRFYANGCSLLTSLGVPDTSGLGSASNYFFAYYAQNCTSLTSLDVPDTSGLSSVGTNFLRSFALGCTSLTSLSVPDTSGLSSVGNTFMYAYAQNCSNLTTLGVPDTSGVISIGSDHMGLYASGCSSLTSLGVPDTSGLTSVGDNFMRNYAYSCSKLTSLGVPDTSGLTSVGDNFMQAYAYSCNALATLILPPTTGWYEDNNINWNVASGRLGILKGVTPNATAKAAWDLLTVSGKTLYTNYIQSPDNVIIDGGEPTTNIPVFMAHYARLRNA